MLHSAYRASLFALYQTAVVIGILLMPVALMARQFGVRLPVGTVIENVGQAYERVR